MMLEGPIKQVIAVGLTGIAIIPLFKIIKSIVESTGGNDKTE